MMIHFEKILYISLLFYPKICWSFQQINVVQLNIHSKMNKRQHSKLKSCVTMNSDENNHKEGPFKQNQAGCITFQASGPGELAEQALWCLLQTNLKHQKDRSQSWVISNTNFVDVLARKQTVEDAVRAVACIPSEAEFALVPIENSVTGTFHQNLELILRYNVAIVGEIEVPLKLHILGMSDESTPSDSSSALNRIKTVAVDPNLYQHCSDFLQASSFEKDFTVSMEACAKKSSE